MHRSYIDHIAITAPSLEIGVEYVRQALGVSLQPGGEHLRMGTHNALLKLGDACYLEVISINPKAPPPGQARWFQLDKPDPSEPVRLAAWIARTDDIHAAASASPIPLGRIEAMSRSSWNWLITVPEDGSLPLDGIAPHLIQWAGGAHPASVLQESGCALVHLEGFHPEPEKIDRMLRAIGFEGEFRVSPVPAGKRPYLVAHIQTPAGLRQFGTH